jgi:hypothetical protein
VCLDGLGGGFIKVKPRCHGTSCARAAHRSICEEEYARVACTKPRNRFNRCGFFSVRETIAQRHVRFLDEFLVEIRTLDWLRLRLQASASDASAAVAPCASLSASELGSSKTWFHASHVPSLPRRPRPFVIFLWDAGPYIL